MRETGGDQGVLDLEAADQRQPESMTLAGVLDANRLGEAVDLGVDQAGSPSPLRPTVMSFNPRCFAAATTASLCS